VEVLEYVDADSYGMVVLGEWVTLDGVAEKTKLAFCPVYVVPGVYIGGEPFPPGDVDQLVAVNDHTNRFETKLNRAIEEVLYGWHDLVGEGSENATILTGPGAVNRLPEGVTHDYKQPAPPPREAFAHVEQALLHMRRLGNWSESASGETQGSIVTGKAISKLQGVMSGQAAETQNNLGTGLSKCNEWMLQMLETYTPKKKYILYSKQPMTTMSSPGRPNSFSVEIIPEQDIQGYYPNQLMYSPFGSDLNAAMQIGMQLVQTDIWSKRHLRNQLPGSSDAEGMAAEIEEEQRKRMALEVDLQTEAQMRIMEKQAEIQQRQAQQQGQMQGGASGGGQVPTEGGQPPTEGSQPPPQGGGGAAQMVGNTLVMPGGQPQMMGMGEPLTGGENFPIPYTAFQPYNQVGDAMFGKTGEKGPTDDRSANSITVEEVQQIIAGIPNLKGQVFIGGEMVQRGSTEGKVALYITSKLDKATVVNAVRDTKLYGRLEFYPINEGEQPQGAIPVTGGQNGIPEATQAA
jgi:hypothetical protein